MNNTTKKMVIGGGCFWCTEAMFQQLKGVLQVVSGYAGGSAETADYETVCSGKTKHAEVVEVRYDPTQISYEELLKIHFATHDPTTLNRQGNDKGPQYRSAIFYANAEEEATAQRLIDDFAPTLYDDPIVTTLEPLVEFFPGEDYHQNYLNRVGDRNPYCSFVVKPKVAKFRKQFADRLAPDASQPTTLGS